MDKPFFVLERNISSPQGVNGVLHHDGKVICQTIELPWKDNKKGESCIPSGIYKLSKRWSGKYGDHLLLHDVPDRQLILIHPANNALKELRGCIAPVMHVDSPGKGSDSRKACKKVFDLAFAQLKLNQLLTIEIKFASL